MFNRIRCPVGVIRSYKDHFRHVHFSPIGIGIDHGRDRFSVWRFGTLWNAYFDIILNLITVFSIGLKLIAEGFGHVQHIDHHGPDGLDTFVINGARQPGGPPAFGGA